jgi:ubiquinone/menaquinone biosynthesis C-methylase UbiE
MHCEGEVVGRLHVGSADQLPFPDGTFDAVISINTLHNFERAGALRALRELIRVSRARRKMFVQVDAYHTPAQRELFMKWVLTAKHHDYPKGWIQLFKEAGYEGDYYWTVLEQ